jgi:non-specific serine/threonine protein kinase
MLETVRQFGAEQLEAEGKADAARAAHAAYFTALAELVTPGPIGIPNHEQLTALRADYANMRSALDYFYRRGVSGGLLRLAFALCTLWQNFGPWTEGIEWMERAAAIEQPTSVTQIEMLIQLGASAGYQGNFARGERWLTKARDAAVRLGEPNVESYALTVLGAQQVDQGCYAAGEALITEALGKARQARDPDAEALAFAHLGVATWGLGRADEAVALLERARASVDQSRLSLSLEVGCRYLGLIAAVSGNLQVAAKQFRESVDYDAFEEHELARWLPKMAVLAVACELPEAAARLFGAAEMLNRITRFVPVWPERGAHELARSQAREQLGELAFAATVSASQAMTRGDVQNLVEHVLSAAENPGQSGAGEDQGEPSPSPLTPREHEVLRLLVEGRSNAEIGDLLYISHRTAQTHVANILSKLGVTTRAHAAARAVRDGLI